RADKLVEGHLEPVALVGPGSGWKFLSLDALDVRVEPGAAQAERLTRRIERHLEVLVWKGADEIGQQSRWSCGRALHGNLCRDELANANLKVRGGERQAFRRGLDEDVVEDRQSRPAGDGTGHDLQRLTKYGRSAGDLHLGCDYFGIQDSCPPFLAFLLIELIRTR